MLSLRWARHRARFILELGVGSFQPCAAPRRGLWSRRAALGSGAARRRRSGWSPAAVPRPGAACAQCSGSGGDAGTSCPGHRARSQRALKVTARLSAPHRPKHTRGQLPACPAGCPGDTAWPPTGLLPPRSSDLQGRTSRDGREVEMSRASWICGRGKCLATRAADPQRESRAQTDLVTQICWSLWLLG